MPPRDPQARRAATTRKLVFCSHCNKDIHPDTERAHRRLSFHVDLEGPAARYLSEAQERVPKRRKPAAQPSSQDPSPDSSLPPQKMLGPSNC